MLRNALMPAEEVERERGGVLEEMKMYEDNPQAKVYQLIGKAIYGDTPLGWGVIGFPEVIKAVSRDEVAAYRQRFYAPGRMTLGIAGNINHALTLSLAQRYFADRALQDLGTAPAGGFNPPPTEHTERDIRHANICLARPCVSQTRPTNERT